jgi:hypothetical protein
MHRPATSKPWRKRPSDSLRYWPGKPDKQSQVKSITVFCVARQEDVLCGHSSVVRIADLPDWDWSDISAHLRCTKCGAVGWVDMRANWPDLFNR